MIFLGTMFDPKDENKILKKSKIGIPNASNLFQVRVLHGLKENGVNNVKTLNVLPVGVWPRQYSHLFLTQKRWSIFGYDCLEIGSLNVPFFKQLIREYYVKKQLELLTESDKEILIYSTYLPFLRAIFKLKPDVKITLIVTDLPDFYDLGKVSALKRKLREINNKEIYRTLKRIDRFVLLTEQMAAALQVGNRPFTVVEGIADNNSENSERKLDSNSDKKIVFYSGTLHYQFGIKKLLDAFELLSETDLELWICGDGDAAEEIRRMSALDQRIKFYGYVSSEEVSQLRACASVLVNPRNNSGEYTKYSFPSKTMEYLMSGIPTIMYKLDGIPDAYDEHVFYIEGNEAQDIAYKILEVIQLDKTERIKFGEDAREFVLREKNEKAQVKKIVELIQQK